MELGPLGGHEIRWSGGRVESVEVIGSTSHSRRGLERRAALLGETRALITAAQRTGRDLTADEDRRVTAALTELRSLNDAIARERERAVNDRRAQLAALAHDEREIRERLDAIRMPFRYSYVPAAAVPPAARALASRAAFEAALDLKLEPIPDVQWFVRTREGRMPHFGQRHDILGLGSCEPMRVALRWPQSTTSIIKSAGHEVAHAYGYSEQLADPYGRDFLERYAWLARSAA